MIRMKSYINIITFHCIHKRVPDQIPEAKMTPKFQKPGPAVQLHSLKKHLAMVIQQETQCNNLKCPVNNELLTYNYCSWHVIEFFELITQNRTHVLMNRLCVKWTGTELFINSSIS